jgi:hypothetical protein
MYWIFLIIFIIVVLVPDIVRSNFYIISETRLEEVLIFFMGAVAFAIFMKNEQQLLFHKKEKVKDEKKIEQAVKDLVESYSYIGEVNRKMDLLMNMFQDLLLILITTSVDLQTVQMVNLVMLKFSKLQELGEITMLEQLLEQSLFKEQQFQEQSLQSCFELKINIKPLELVM